MNKERRKLIENAIEKINEAKDELENIRGEEENYRDNMPESFRNSDKGEIAENAISNLDGAISQLEEAISNAESAME